MKKYVRSQSNVVVKSDFLTMRSATQHKWPHKTHPGYFRVSSIFPFYIILFTARQIQYVLSLKGLVFLHLDATGTTPYS